jgi:hypothetical protein
MKYPNHLWTKVILSLVFVIVLGFIFSSHFPSPSPALQLVQVGSSGSITAVINASRTECVAPCAVFFDATGTTGLTDNDYVGASFWWDFDSTNIDSQGTDKKATGFLEAHVYEKPGTYVATVNVKDKEGNAGNSSVQITVNNFAGTTYYVANNGDDTNPGTIELPLKTINYAITQKAFSNTRILFRNGDEFNFTRVLIGNRAGPVLIGAYTDPNNPSANKPIFKSNSTYSSGIIGLRGVSDWRITDIHIIGIYGDVGILGDSASSNILVQGVEIEKTDYNIIFYSDGFFVFDSDLHDSYTTANYGTAHRLAYVNNYIHDYAADNTGGHHGIRIARGDKTVFRNNNMGAGFAASSLTIRGAGGGTNNDLVVVGNYFGLRTETANSGSTGWETESAHRILFEKNTFASTLGFGINTSNVVIRNNKFINRFAVEFRYQSYLNFDSFDIYHNTHLAGLNVSESADRVFLDTGYSRGFASLKNIRVRNNIFVSPGTGFSPFLFFHDTLNELTESNNVLYAPKQVNWKPYINGWLDGRYRSYNLADWQQLGKGQNDQIGDPLLADISSDDLHLGSTSLAINTGTPVPVYDDFDGNLRTDGMPDIGAYEYSGVIPPPNPSTHLITVTAGSHGAIIPATVKVTEDNDQTFTITPDSGYQLNTLTIDGKNVAISSPYTFKKVKTTHTIIATFVATGVTTPTDFDNDGIPDTTDLCPKTPTNLKTLVNQKGCPKPKTGQLDIKPDFNTKDLRAVTGVELGIGNYAKITYPPATAIPFVRESGDHHNQLDLEDGLTIQARKITLDTAKLPELNQSATLTFYQLTFTNPRILKDGVLCASCGTPTYQNGTLSFTITGFSTYEIVEGETTQISNIETNTTRVSSGGTAGSRIVAPLTPAARLTLIKQLQQQLLSLLQQLLQLLLAARGLPIR